MLRSENAVLCMLAKYTPHCVTLGPSTPKKKGSKPPIFGQCLLWPNGWMNQDATWYRGRPRPRRRCVRYGDPAPPKMGHSNSTLCKDGNFALAAVFMCTYASVFCHVVYFYILFLCLCLCTLSLSQFLCCPQA